MTSNDATTRHAAIMTSTTMSQVREKIEEIARNEGLGVAMTVAWQHGLTSRYIPLTIKNPLTGENEPTVRITAATPECPYTFVHVPVRRIRGNTEVLIRLTIMSGSPDPAQLCYHEDGIIEARTFTGDRFATLPVQATVNAALGGSWGEAPTGEVGGTLQRRSPCFYCSAETLFPGEVTVSTRDCLPDDARASLARDYRLGFTFAPVGHPGEICHFLAWDDPPPGTPIENMDLHPHSLRDLVHLVRLLDQDTTPGGDRAPLWGICNHRAGNTIAHQHYQFLRLASLPLDDAFQSAIADGLKPISALDGIGIWALGPAWPTPAYLIKPLPGITDDPDRTDDALLARVDLVTEAWRSVQSRNATQNLIVTSRDGQTRAFFLPRDHRKVDATHHGHAKKNAGTLEAAGYVVIDDPDAYQRITNLPDDQRRALGTGWLTGIAPEPEWISRFEDQLIAEDAARDPVRAR